jgi:hypothetical protein
MIIYMIFKWELKWRFIVFFLIHFDHYIILYNIYDQRWMSFSYESDDMQRNFFICMKKFENDSLIEEIENLMKMMNWEIENLIKMKSARFSFSINHFHTIIIECHFRMNLMTCKKNFHLYKKIRKRSSEKASDELNDEFSSSSRFRSSHHSL